MGTKIKSCATIDNSNGGQFYNLWESHFCRIMLYVTFYRFLELVGFLGFKVLFVCQINLLLKPRLGLLHWSMRSDGCLMTYWQPKVLISCRFFLLEISLYFSYSLFKLKHLLFHASNLVKHSLWMSYMLQNSCGTYFELVYIFQGT